MQPVLTPSAVSGLYVRVTASGMTFTGTTGSCSLKLNSAILA